VLIETFGESIDTQLRALQTWPKKRLAAFQVTPEGSAFRCVWQETARLCRWPISRFAVHDRASFRLDLAAKGHLWQRGADKDKALGLSLWWVTIHRGPSSGGQGPLASMACRSACWALFTPCRPACAAFSH